MAHVDRSELNWSVWGVLFVAVIFAIGYALLPEFSSARSVIALGILTVLTSLIIIIYLLNGRAIAFFLYSSAINLSLGFFCFYISLDEWQGVVGPSGLFLNLALFATGFLACLFGWKNGEGSLPEGSPNEFSERLNPDSGIYSLFVPSHLSSGFRDRVGKVLLRYLPLAIMLVVYFDFHFGKTHPDLNRLVNSIGGFPLAILWSYLTGRSLRRLSWCWHSEGKLQKTIRLAEFVSERSGGG